MSDPTIPQDDKFHQDTNEIHDFATKVSVGWARFGNFITIGIGLGVLAFVAAGPMEWFGRQNLLDTYKNKHQEEVYRDLTSDSPEVLAAQSLTCKEPKVGALMALRSADLFLKKSQIEEKEEDAKKALERAEKLYAQVTASPAAADLLKINARLGLASVAESKADWAGAEAAYDQIIKTPGVLPNLADMAQIRKDRIASIKPPVVFGPEPVKIETPAEPAATKPAEVAPIVATPTVPATTPAPAPLAPAAPQSK